MSINGNILSWSSINSFLRQIGAYFGLVVAVANTFSLNSTLRGDIVLVSGALLAAEHYANAQNPATAPQSNAIGTTRIELSTAPPTTTGTP